MRCRFLRRSSAKISTRTVTFQAIQNAMRAVFAEATAQVLRRNCKIPISMARNLSFSYRGERPPVQAHNLLTLGGKVNRSVKMRSSSILTAGSWWTRNSSSRSGTLNLTFENYVTWSRPLPKMERQFAKSIRWKEVSAKPFC